ncbi:peroxiredoxin-like family protein [Bordetella bronchiseptica]|uniref:Alkyl hydroperoxide reductase subunit C/ Thiol specific antioxidant domain-containing protein n=1 Tax=Bordetella bronchiseptica (strain ATCC BAA-588 / NCTC 13252 / RB50) TaxID=257310 RepID=A0A0H3LNY4_BORBR|nr:peroxiredoxin-like family protein [Bordetella bronchiseptica]KAK66366.1 antioxidant, AhpC/TSA family [Bordetella bronchiseptica 980-2]KDD49809.1 antioxidant, AhpC/TSA family [Bordetella bronchiseptica OSU553]AMG87599.1 AhpC/TSA family protein [Bordetella bronchiseptica]KCV47007.1 antioxidant, AhpC/TSA family [Bordetella bronchiseptica 3E44]KCV64779.1 antioxidant, AhpC/TSA family [Bordetella bronchiseptica 980]
MNPAIAAGRRLADYVLPDHTKTLRRLSALQGDDPMLLVLIRGFFCPKDREQLKALTRFHPQLVVGNCRLVVITTDDWHTTNNLRQQLGAHYPFLYDEERRVRDDLDILEYTDPQHEPMVPHTLLLAPGLEIRRIWNGYYYWGRPSTAELHDALREVTRDIRPDWDLSDPELKRRWAAGDKSAFFPYGSKSMEQTLKEMAGAVDQYAGRA